MAEAPPPRSAADHAAPQQADAPSTVAIVVAGGSGVRAGGPVPKQYALLGGRPVIAHAITSLASHPGIAAVQPVIGAGQEALFAEVANGARTAVTGGATRQASVLAGLEAIAAAGGARHVLIHDAARPFVPHAVIDRLLAALDEAPGAVPVLPVVDSLAHGGESLGASAPRAGIVRVQTPQAFRFDAILAAHRAAAGGDAGDDAQLAREADFRVATVAGDAALSKLTHAADFAAAEARLAARLIARTGMGFDVHAFAPGDQVTICGVPIAHSARLAGHSDADVGLHALTDALLGGIASGDIGSHFPPSDPQWRGADSVRFLAHARDLVAAAGGFIDHVDVTIICEAPKIGPHRDAMRARIADVLQLAPARVSVKATTTERLGFTGRGEGIAAQAIATVRLPGDDGFRG